MLKRNTIQRALVLKTVRKLKSHPTAEEVYTEVAKEHPTISRGTVYRNLNHLASSGEIKSREIPCGANCYDHRCDDHYHAKCLRCGKVFDVDMEYIPDLGKNINDTHGFEFSGYDLVFKGVCAECKKRT
ncbi:MAG: transcriptional repressor [Oscillospiraceae bacterium]|nr:transcriptional repressor [Oscillospiraceae bacterium]